MSPEKVITEALRGLVGGPGFLADTALSALRASGYAVIALPESDDWAFCEEWERQYPTTAGYRTGVLNGRVRMGYEDSFTTAEARSLAAALLAAADAAESVSDEDPVGVLPEQEKP